MADGTVKRLNMVFETVAETTFNLSLNEPDPELDPQDLMIKMEQIADKGVLMDAKGNDALGAHSATLVTTTTETLF